MSRARVQLTHPELTGAGSTQRSDRGSLMSHRWIGTRPANAQQVRALRRGGGRNKKQRSKHNWQKRGERVQLPPSLFHSSSPSGAPWVKNRPNLLHAQACSSSDDLLCKYERLQCVCCGRFFPLERRPAATLSTFNTDLFYIPQRWFLLPLPKVTSFCFGSRRWGLWRPLTLTLEPCVTAWSDLELRVQQGLQQTLSVCVLVLYNMPEYGSAGCVNSAHLALRSVCFHQPHTPLHSDHHTHANYTNSVENIPLL